jgi:hypothetical protein
MNKTNNQLSGMIRMVMGRGKIQRKVQLHSFQSSEIWFGGKGRGL